MRKKASLQTILWLILLVYLSACAGKKQQKIALPADFKGPKELGRLYGVRITPEDNIFLYNEGARWLGVPHKLGGSTKRGVDCSGFTRYVLQNGAGVSVARSSRSQAGQGQQVSAEQMRPGDLVFYSSGGSINHVAMYIGSGQVVHASTYETGIKTSPWNYRAPVKIMNVIGD